MRVKVEWIHYGPCRTSLLVLLCLQKEGDIFSTLVETLKIFLLGVGRNQGIL